MKGVTTFMLFLCCYVTNITAQPFTGFQKVEGLNSNVVYCVMQDSKGYIWVGTEAGAARFDGYKFTFFTVDDGLTDNDIFQIKEDSKGRLWFLNNSGKPCIYDNGRILNENNTKWLQEIQPKKLAIHFVENNPNDIWYSTLDTAYHLHNNKVVEKLTVPTNTKGIHNIQCVALYKGNTYLLHNSGIFNATKSTHFYFNEDCIITSLHTRVLQQSNSLLFFRFNKLIRFSFETSDANILTKSKNAETFINFLQVSSTDSMVLSTSNNIYKLSIHNGSFDKQFHFSAEMISGMLLDVEGNYWQSSLTNGLFINRKKNNSNTIKIQNEKLPVFLKCWSVDKINNSIYFGYDAGQYVEFKNAEILYKRIYNNDIRRKISQIYALNNVLYIINANAITQLLNNRLIEASFTAKQMEINNGFAYMATSGGLIKYPLKNNIIYGNEYAKYLTAERVSKLLITAKDSIWIGGILGLQLLVKEKKINYTPLNEPIAKGFITKIRKGNKGEIIFSTNNRGIGIIYGDSVYTINQSSGLLSNSCNDIYVNKNGNIWVATSKGINHINFSFQKNKSISYTIENFSSIIQTATPNINAVLQSGDTLFLAGDDGAYFHLLSKQKNTIVYPKLNIEKLIINDKMYPVKSSYNLSYNQNRIRINFVGIAYQAAGKIKYRYKLEPVDTNWQETENTSIEYPYLSPGNYQFKINASFQFGNWSNAESSIHINIYPPFWKRTWFLVVLILFSIALFYLIIRYIINNIQTKHRLHNEQLHFQKQVAELEHQSLRLQMNPHFIFNAIYAIQGFYATGDTFLAKQYIAKLATLVRQILQTGRVSSIKLIEEIELLKNYVELYQLKLESPIHFNVIIDKSVNENEDAIPPMILQPIVENALIHGIATLLDGAIISLNIKRIGNILECIVTDNGIGRKQAASHSHGIEKQSIGLTVTEKRLQMLYKNEELSLPVIEMKDAFPHYQNPGTIVILRIPIQ